MAPSITSDLIKAAIASHGEPLRQRATFFLLGQLLIGPANTHIPAARTILAETLEDDGTIDVENTPDELISRIVLVCSALAGSFQKDASGDCWCDIDQATKVIAEVPGTVPEAVKIGIDAKRQLTIEPRTALGVIVTDGITIALNDLPIRKCRWCQNYFAPLRRDAEYCRPSCRAAAGNKRSRQAQKDQ